MDRDNIVRIARLAAFGGLTKTDVNEVLIAYCLEHGKIQDESINFINKLFEITYLLEYCFNIALSYYKRKFTVCELWSSPYPDPLNIQEQRKLLQIF